MSAPVWPLRRIRPGATEGVVAEAGRLLCLHARRVMRRNWTRSTAADTIIEMIWSLSASAALLSARESISFTAAWARISSNRRIPGCDHERDDPMAEFIQEPGGHQRAHTGWTARELYGAAVLVLERFDLLGQSAAH